MRTLIYCVIEQPGMKIGGCLKMLQSYPFWNPNVLLFDIIAVTVTGTWLGTPNLSNRQK